MARLLIFSFLFVSFTLNGLAQEELSTSSSDTTITEVQVVELSELSKETNRLHEKIKRAKNYLNTLDVLSEIDLQLEHLSQKIILLDSSTTIRLEEDPSIRTLRELEALWNEIDKKSSKLEEKIQGTFSDLKSHKSLIDKEKERWVLTRANLIDSENKDIVDSTLQNNLIIIDEALAQLADSTTSTLEINNKVISFKSHMLEIENNLNAFEDEQLTGLFTLNQPAIWNTLTSKNDSSGIGAQVTTSWGFIVSDSKYFLSKSGNRGIFHLLFFIFLLGFFFFLSANISSWENFQGDAVKPTIQFLSKPLWAAIFVAILFSNTIYKDMPIIVKNFNALLALIPLVFLLPQLLPKKFHVIIYLLATTFFLDQLSSILGTYDATKRWVVLVEGFISLSGFLLLYRIVSSDFKLMYKQQPLFSSFFPLVIVAIVLLIMATLGNIRGYTTFAFYVVRAVVFSSVAMFLFFVIISMSKGLFTLFFYGKFMQKSNIVAIHKQNLTKSSLWLLKFYLTLVWFKIVLVQFGFYTSIEDYFKLVSDISWEFGSVSFTLGHLWDAIWVIIVAWFLGLVIKSLLQEEILPRFHLKRGLPAAIGVSTRYFIITLGFFLAVASLGIDLNKLGFIAGALSVGIGFGLQNIVGNFISGLILLFERPIVAGDLIVMDALDGVVLEIGLRASKVKTWDGAEVIVPNGDLITKQVTNLTLSDKNRRREIVLETERDAEPREIIKAIYDTVIKNPEVLSEPSPQILFKGQFQNYYRFRVLYWVTGNVLVVGSDISLRINETLKNMNVRIAIPESRINLGDSEVKKTSGK